jgi:tyrosine-protein kinase Etk/Wzc
MSTGLADTLNSNSNNNNNHQHAKQEALSKFSYREFLLKHLKYIPWILISVSLFLIGAYIKLRYSPRVYRVDGSMLIKNDNPYGGGNDRFDDIFMMSQSNINLNNEIEILKSRPLLQRVAARLGLQYRYMNKGNIRSTIIYGNSPVMLDIVSQPDSTRAFGVEINVANDNSFTIGEANQKYAFGQEITLGNVGFRILRRQEIDLKGFASNQFVLQKMTLAQATEGLVGSIKIAQASNYSQILDISFQTENPRMGEDIINELFKVYNQYNIDDKNRIANNTLHFIEERLDTLRLELGGVELDLQRFQEANQAFDLESQSELYLSNLSETNRMLSEQEVKIGVIDYLIEYVAKPANQYRTIPNNLVVEDPTLLTLIGQYNGLLLQRETNLKTAPANHPTIRQMDANLEKLHVDILEALQNVRRAFIMTRDQFVRKSFESKGHIQSVPGKARRLLDIQRQQKLKQDLYLFLLQKREETAIGSAATVANSKVVEPALGSRNPVAPNRRNLYALAIFAGLGIPILIIILIELFNDKINSRLDVEKNTHAPILGEIGHSDEGVTLVTRQNSRKFIAEQFRIIRTNLQYILNKVPKPVILVTSSFSGEGKSFVSTNMGAVMALAGKRTVILEFDIRKPKVVSGLELARNSGITNFIVGKTPPEELPIPVPSVENLFVISCGPLPPNPAELLLDERVNDLFKWVRANFDVVIVDTAPVGLVSDAVVLGKFADCTLYITRHHYTLKKQVVLIDQLYSENKLPRLSIIINDIKGRTGSYNGYYGYGGYGYGYGYGYGSGYFEDGKNTKTLGKRIKAFFKM